MTSSACGMLSAYIYSSTAYISFVSIGLAGRRRCKFAHSGRVEFEVSLLGLSNIVEGLVKDFESSFCDLVGHGIVL